MKKSYLKWFVLLGSLIIILVFYLWSNLGWISLLLLIVVDSFSTQIVARALKNKIPAPLFGFLKYSYFLLLPIALAVFIRSFFFNMYFVPSDSMERTLFPEDYVLVDKISYGTKVPKYLQDVPMIGSFFKKPHREPQYDLYRGLTPFKKFEREDIVVFKSTESNDVFLIKRIIGMPGDTLMIQNTKVFINGKALKEKKEYCYDYIDSTNHVAKSVRTLSNVEYTRLREKEKRNLARDIETVPDKKMRSSYFGKHQWTRDNYGILVIPKKGMTMILNDSNFSIYESIIKAYEGQDIQLPKGGEVAYTFKNSYYFMMGDNRHHSRDSRSYGLVPEFYIQGKLIYTFSK